MKKLAVLAVLSAATLVMADNRLEITLDQQITHPTLYTDQSPNGDAIYAAFDSGTLTFEGGAPPDKSDGFARFTKNGGGWWYMYVDTQLAGAGNIDITGAQLKIDSRAWEYNTGNPYGDVNVFLRVYSYGPDVNGNYTVLTGFRDYGIVYGPNASSFPFGDWNNWNQIVVDLEGGTTTNSSGNGFDPTNVNRIRFYGTNWAGQGQDQSDFVNLVVTPEPTAFALLALGVAAFIRRR